MHTHSTHPFKICIFIYDFPIFVSFLKWYLVKTLYTAHVYTILIVLFRRSSILFEYSRIVLKYSVSRWSKMPNETTRKMGRKDKTEKKNKNNDKISGRIADVHVPLATRCMYEIVLSFKSLFTHRITFFGICVYLYDNVLMMRYLKKKTLFNVFGNMVFNSYFYIYPINFHFT